MNELRNLLVWFKLDDQGEIEAISKFSAIDPKVDLVKHFAKWSEQSKHRSANVYTFIQKNITVPESIMLGPVETDAIIMHYNSKPIMAIMPYFVAIGGKNDLAR